MARYSLAQLQSLLRSVGWPESEIAKMAAIIIYESGGRSDVINPGIRGYKPEYSVGLAQINTLSHKEYSVQQLTDPTINLGFALRLWRNRPDYGDWFLSRGKYNANKDGVAAQSRAIYSGGGDNNVITTANVNQIINNAVDTLPSNTNDTDSSSNIMIYAAAGLLIFALIRS